MAGAGARIADILGAAITVLEAGHIRINPADIRVADIDVAFRRDRRGGLGVAASMRLGVTDIRRAGIAIIAIRVGETAAGNGGANTRALIITGIGAGAGVAVIARPARRWDIGATALLDATPVGGAGIAIVTRDPRMLAEAGRGAGIGRAGIGVVALVIRLAFRRCRARPQMIARMVLKMGLRRTRRHHQFLRISWIARRHMA